MDNLHKIFSNLFEVNTASNKKVIAFANDHVAKMIHIDKKLYANCIQQTTLLIKNLEVEIENKNKISTKLLIEQLGQQLTKNAITIAYQNNDNSMAIDLFFETKILRKKTSKKTSKQTVAAYTKVVVDFEDGFIPEKRVRVMNKGKVTLSVQFLLKEKAVGKTFKVAPRKILDKLFSDFYTNADAIQITNLYSTDCMCLIQEIV